MTRTAFPDKWISGATVEVGHRNASEAEVIKGLNEGVDVILHPANNLKDGARVMIRRN